MEFCVMNQHDFILEIVHKSSNIRKVPISICYNCKVGKWKIFYSFIKIILNGRIGIIIIWYITCAAYFTTILEEATFKLFIFSWVGMLMRFNIHIYFSHAIHSHKAFSKPFHIFTCGSKSLQFQKLSLIVLSSFWLFARIFHLFDTSLVSW